MNRRLILCALACALATPAVAVELTVLSSGGLTPAYRVLAPEFEHRSGDTLHLELGASMGETPTSIPSRVKRGEPADVVLMVGYALDDLIKQGGALPGSRVDIARSSIGMAVRTGAPKPDISTLEALKQTLLAAKSIAYSDSASGVYLVKELFPRLGISEQMNRTARMIPGDPVAGVVARGEAELGIQQIAELKAVAGVDVVGALPADAQKITVYAAGIVTASKNPAEAKKLIDFLASPDAAPAVRETGLETMQ